MTHYINPIPRGPKVQKTEIRPPDTSDDKTVSENGGKFFTHRKKSKHTADPNRHLLTYFIFARKTGCRSETLPEQLHGLLVPESVSAAGLSDVVCNVLDNLADLRSRTLPDPVPDFGDGFHHLDLCDVRVS